MTEQAKAKRDELVQQYPLSMGASAFGIRGAVRFGFDAGYAEREKELNFISDANMSLFEKNAKLVEALRFCAQLDKPDVDAFYVETQSLVKEARATLRELGIEVKP